MPMSEDFWRQVTSGEVVPVLPPFYENTIEGGFEPMPDDMLLVQPCVVKALRAARADALEYAAKECEDLRESIAGHTSERAATLRDGYEYTANRLRARI